MSWLRRIARRCETHDVASPVVTSRLEAEVGIRSDPDSGLSFTDSYANPDLIDCGHTWCSHSSRRRR